MKSRASAFATVLALSAACAGLTGFKAAAPQVKPLAIPAPKNFPDQDTFSMQGSRWVTSYEADSVLQARSLIYLSRFKPGMGVLAVCDLKSGKVLALAERSASGLSSQPKLALEATFPAASLIKILTASAALEWNNAQPEDSLPLRGRTHTLYRFQLQLPKYNNYPKISLEYAFAKSVNPVFGSLGMDLGAAAIRKMGIAMGFNQPQPLPECRPSRLDVPDSGFGLAQVSCGYTTTTTLSPLHALRIARGIGDDGRLRPLVFTSELRDIKTGNHFTVADTPSDPFVSPATLSNLRTLMNATVETGTARKGFRRALGRQDLSNLEMGGKTGSLNGENPPGRYEWYIGYARVKDHPDQGIAVSVMVINQNNRIVHASEMAGLLIRDWNNPSLMAGSPWTPRYSRVKSSRVSKVLHKHNRSRRATIAER